MLWPEPAAPWRVPTTPWSKKRAARSSARAIHLGLAAGISLLGGLLRLYHFDALSLWVDEGLTVDFARLPWSILLGFGRVYSPHPPLYFALVKLLSTVCPELVAGRLISVLAGTLTLAVLYALGTRLLHPGAGLLACLALSLSPLHIWYSQEARPYALAVLLVALSYLALVAFYQEAQRCWLAIYGLALVGALYTDASAFFALVPQAAVHAAMFMRFRARAQAAIATVAMAATAYLPWLPRLLQVAGPTSAQDQFTLTPERVAGSLLTLGGLAANQAVFSGPALPPWNLWPAAHWPLVLALVLVLGLGTLGLARHSLLALLSAWGVGGGTVLVATAISLVYPSYVERTILAAALGWALAMGAAPFVPRRPRTLAILAGLGAAAILSQSLFTLWALDTDAYKQEWRSLAQETALAARFGWPVVSYPSVAGTLIELYQPRALAHRTIALADGARLPGAVLAGRGRAAGLWLAYIAGSGEQSLQAQLATRGYVRLVHLYYAYPLYLDLYLRPGTPLGPPLAINGRFEGTAGQASGWQLPLPGSTLVADGALGRRLILTNRLPGESAARTATAAVPNRLYTLEAQAQAHLRAGTGRAFLICVSATGTMLAVAPDGGGASVANDGRWHDVWIGALCPAGTDHVRVDLRNSGSGTVTFRSVTLHELQPAYGSGMDSAANTR